MLELQAAPASVNLQPAHGGFFRLTRRSPRARVPCYTIGVNHLSPSRLARVKETADNANLLPRVAAGEMDAVRACLDRYQGLVWSLARGMCRTSSDAEDACQEIFIELWKHAGRFDPAVASETTFVAMIARRRLIDRRRRAANEQASEPLDQRTDATAPRESDPIEQAEEIARASAAIRTLPVDAQAALKLNIYEGLSHSEVAERLGTPLGTVKSRIRRSLNALRQALSQESLASETGGSP